MSFVTRVAGRLGADGNTPMGTKQALASATHCVLLSLQGACGYRNHPLSLCRLCLCKRLTINDLKAFIFSYFTSDRSLQERNSKFIRRARPERAFSVFYPRVRKRRRRPNERWGTKCTPIAFSYSRSEFGRKTNRKRERLRLNKGSVRVRVSNTQQ